MTGARFAAAASVLGLEAVSLMRNPETLLDLSEPIVMVLQHFMMHLMHLVMMLMVLMVLLVPVVVAIETFLVHLHLRAFEHPFAFMLSVPTFSSHVTLFALALVFTIFAAPLDFAFYGLSVHVTGHL